MCRTADDPDLESNSATVRVGLCLPPPSGDWMVAHSCSFCGQRVAPADVIVAPRVVLTIAADAVLEIDLHTYKLLVRKPGGVLIKHEGTVRQTTERTRKQKGETDE